MSAPRLVLVKPRACPTPNGKRPPPLTRLQAQYLEVIAQHFLTQHTCPSQRVVAEAIGQRTSTYANLECLRRKGLVTWTYGVRGSLRLTAEGWYRRALHVEGRAA